MRSTSHLDFFLPAESHPRLRVSVVSRQEAMDIKNVSRSIFIHKFNVTVHQGRTTENIVLLCECVKIMGIITFTSCENTLKPKCMLLVLHCSLISDSVPVPTPSETSWSTRMPCPKWQQVVCFYRPSCSSSNKHFSSPILRYFDQFTKLSSAVSGWNCLLAKHVQTR